MKLKELRKVSAFRILLGKESPLNPAGKVLLFPFIVALCTMFDCLDLLFTKSTEN